VFYLHDNVRIKACMNELKRAQDMRKREAFLNEKNFK